MDTEDGSYVCPACGGLVRKLRRQVHEGQWCPVLAKAAGGDEDTDSDDGAADGQQLVLPEVRTLLSPQYLAEIPVELSFSPLAFRFTQSHDNVLGKYDRHAEFATGGQLWWSELVLAEYLALTRRGPPGAADSEGADGPPRQRVAIALGCGTAPVSAFVAAALGWEVLCTDLPEVLPLTQKNYRENALVTQAAHLALGRAGPHMGSVDFLPLPFGEPLPDKTRGWIESRGRAQLVLCSDCIWQAHRHRPLAVTLAEILGGTPGSEALVAYQVRRMAERQFFDTIRHYNLQSERLDIAAAVAQVHFPRQFAHLAEAADSFCVHRLWSTAPAP